MNSLRIAVITCNKDTFSNPSLVAFFTCCKERNIVIDLYSPSQVFELPSSLDNVFIHLFDPKKFFHTRKAKAIIFSYQYFLILVALLRKKPVTIMGVDPQGIIMAGRLNLLLRKKLVYYSFEIFFRDEMYNLYYKMIKECETYYSKRSDIIVIQDTLRKDMLASENLISKRANWQYVPVAPLRGDHEFTSMNLLEKYGVPRGKTVIVMSGSIDSWSGIDYVIYALEKGIHPDNWIFIHSRYKLDSKNVKHQKLIDLARSGAQVTLNDQYFARESAYYNFLCSFDFGLVLYIPEVGVYTGKNIKCIGLASGKFASYCMLGMSIIFHSDNGYEYLNNQYNFGYSVSDVDEFAKLLSAPLGPKKTIESKKVYKEKLEPTKSINQLIDQITEPK